jgi:uncharacterized protein YneF (UPF0154 family)
MDAQTSNALADAYSVRTRPSFTGLRCPLCAAPLGPDPIAFSSLKGEQLICVRCRALWECEPRTQASDQVWIAGGACAVFAASTLAAAIWAGASSVCIEVVEDSNLHCADRPTFGPWILSAEILGIAAGAAALAAVILPAMIGVRASRRYWWHLARFALVLGVVAGAGLGIWSTKRYVTDLFWSNPALSSQLVFLTITAVLLIWAVGTIVSYELNRDLSRWRLTQIFPDLKEGNSGSVTLPLSRLRILPAFYDPAPYIPPARDDS